MEAGIGLVHVSRVSIRRSVTFRIMAEIITDGTEQKSLFDCKRGLMGLFRADAKDEKQMVFVAKGTREFEEYLSVCQAITHKAPYVPE